MAILIDDGILWETEQQPQAEPDIDKDSELYVRMDVASKFGLMARTFYEEHPGVIAMFKHQFQTALEKGEPTADDIRLIMMLPERFSVDRLVDEAMYKWLRDTDFYRTKLDNFIDIFKKSKHDAHGALYQFSDQMVDQLSHISKADQVISRISTIDKESLSEAKNYMFPVIKEVFGSPKEYLQFLQSYHLLNAILDSDGVMNTGVQLSFDKRLSFLNRTIGLHRRTVDLNEVYIIYGEKSIGADSATY